MENSKPVNNNDYCCVKGCQSDARTHPNIHFYRFPKVNTRLVSQVNYFDKIEYIDKYTAWKNAVKLKDVGPRMKVCSLHFTKSDYNFPGFLSIPDDIPTKKKFLKRNSVPSLNLPGMKSMKKEQKNKERQARRLQKEERVKQSALKRNIEPGKSVSEQKAPIDVDDSVNDQTPSPIPDVEISSGVINSELVSSHEPWESALLVTEIHDIRDENVVSMKDCGVQVNSDYVHTPFSNRLTDNARMSTVTGIESIEILGTIVEIVKSVYGDRFEKRLLKTRDRIILVFMKLKQNLSYRLLSIIFDCYSSQHCKRVFYEMIQLLSACLRDIIYWPAKEEVLRNIPLCFKGFENVRVVLDCTEIFIERPKEVCCQLIAYSQYKKGLTGKFLTGVSPSGLITFISQVYGGRVSDKAIFAQSELLNLLEPGDSIMVDRGFMIDELCQKNRWKCIRPPFMKDKKQFSKEEAIETSRIAAARVHIERSNQRIKSFKILGSKMPVALLPLLEDIFTVVCATVNLSSPILKDDKF